MITLGYRELHGVTRGYKGLQGSYRRLLEVTRG